MLVTGTSAFASGVTVPKLAVAAANVTSKLLLDIVDKDPTPPVPATPVGLTVAPALTDSSPSVPTFALAVTPVTAAPAVIAYLTKRLTLIL